MRANRIKRTKEEVADNLARHKHFFEQFPKGQKLYFRIVQISSSTELIRFYIPHMQGGEMLIEDCTFRFIQSLDLHLSEQTGFPFCSGIQCLRGDSNAEQLIIEMGKRMFNQPYFFNAQCVES